jgi:hypothetical protein
MSEFGFREGERPEALPAIAGDAPFWESVDAQPAAATVKQAKSSIHLVAVISLFRMASIRGR